MIKERILLLLQQKLISKRKFEKKTGLNISSSFSDSSFSDDPREGAVSNYFNVSKTYLNEIFDYNFLLKFGNFFIIGIFIVSLIPLIVVYANKSIDTIYLLISSIMACVFLIPTMLFYRRYRLCVLLLIPLFFAFYLLGLFTTYTLLFGNKFLRSETNLIFG